MKIGNINLIRKLSIVVFAISFNGILCFSGYAYESFFEKGREIKYKESSAEIKKIPSAEYDFLFPIEGIRVKKKVYLKKSNSQSYKQSISENSKITSVLSNDVQQKKNIALEKGNKEDLESKNPINRHSKSLTLLPVPTIKQATMECGPTSLAMVMKYYNPNKNINPGDIMADHAPTFLGVDPLSIKETAQENGYKANVVNNGTLEELAYLIDHGIPVIVFGQWGNSDSSHYMVVTGYGRMDGNIATIYCNDPASGTSKLYDADKFVNNFWENDVRIKGAKFIYCDST